jgi:hypothetical protein
MPDLVTLVRPDGKLVSVKPSDVADLKLLGYRPMEHEEQFAHSKEEAERSYYSGGLQQVEAGAEGFLSGLTMGGSDILLNDDASRKRAAYNPGTRTVGEIAGIIVPAFATGGEALLSEGLAKGATREAEQGLFRSALNLSPVAAVGRESAALGERLAGRGIAGKVVGGAVEGAAFGGNSELVHSELSGDPLTAEQVLASMGYGALFGGATAGIGGKLEEYGSKALSAVKARQAEDVFASFGGLGKAERRIPTAVAERVETVPLGVTDPTYKSAIDAREAASKAFLPDEHWQVFRSAAKDARDAADKAFDAADQAHRAVSSFNKLPPVERLGKLGDVGTSVMNAAAASGLKKELSSVRGAWRWASEAIKSGDAAKIEKQLSKYQEAVDRLAAASGQTAAWPTKALKNSMQEVGEFNHAAHELWGDLNSRGSDADRFFSNASSSAEPLFGKFNAVMSSKLPEAAPIQAAMSRAIDNMVEKAGIKVEGSASDKLRALWANGKALRDGAAEQYMLAQAKGVRVTERRWAPSKVKASTFERGPRSKPDLSGLKPAPKDGIRDLITKGAAHSAAWAATGVIPGAGWMVRSALTKVLLGAKAKAAEVVTAAASKIGQPLGRAVREGGPFIYPLYHGLDGIQDPEGNLQEAFARRSQELRDAAVTAKNQAFQLAQDLAAAGHPSLGEALYAHAPTVVETMIARLPRTPINTMWGNDYIYEVPEEQLAVFSQAYMAGSAPLQFLTEAAAHPTDVFPDSIAVLREAWPQLYASFRTQGLMKLMEQDTSKMSHEDLVGWSVLLDVPLAPTMSNDFIAAQAAMWAEPPQQQQGATTAGSGNGGRPPGPGPSPVNNPDATRAQQLEAR